MNFTFLSTLNAILNSVSAILLVIGYVMIKKQMRLKHKLWMLSALAVSGLFLTSYLIYHANVGSQPYPYYDWTRTLYFVILIPHVLLAGLMTPFIALMVVFALRNRFPLHKRIAKIIWPVWMFVSVSGVFIYLMLYRF